LSGGLGVCKRSQARGGGGKKKLKVEGVTSFDSGKSKQQKKVPEGGTTRVNPLCKKPSIRSKKLKKTPNHLGANRSLVRENKKIPWSITRKT